MGSQNILRIVVSNCNGITYGNAYLITFKVEHLRTDTCSIDPAIVGSTDGRHLSKSSGVRPSIWFDVLHGCVTCSLEAHLRSREQQKVTRSEIRRVQWLGDDRNVFLDKELLHNKRSVARCLIRMQKPMSLSFVAPLTPNCIAQPLQNLHVEMTSNTLSRRYELMVHQIFDVEMFLELFDCPSYFESSVHIFHV
jgi:hypothetical protein